MRPTFVVILFVVILPLHVLPCFHLLGFLIFLRFHLLGDRFRCVVWAFSDYGFMSVCWGRSSVVTPIA